MNRLEPAVRGVMQSIGLKQLSEAADKTGIRKSALSKIFLGQIGLSPENLHKLVNGLSDEPAHQFQILAAHLYDEAERGSRALATRMRIQMADVDADDIGFSDLPGALQRQLRVIADRVQGGDQDLGAAVGWLAGSIRSIETLGLAAEDQSRYGGPDDDLPGDALRNRAGQPPPPIAPKPKRPGSEKAKG